MDVKFEKCGLVLGLINYPFKLEGKELYRKVFEAQFFPNYRRGINKYFEKNGLSDYLYKPKGYRLFGNYGLLVISLIDDFAFCDRIFHANHGYRDSDKDADSNYQYSSKVITGISSNEIGGSLVDKARLTFLLDENSAKKRYPYVGINKLKINNALLFGFGCEKIESIKKMLLALSDDVNSKNGLFFDSIIVDCFDNDELVVVSFSNSITELDHFFLTIKNLHFPVSSSNENQPQKSVITFLSSYINIGYDIDYSFDSVDLNHKFLDSVDDHVKIRLIWEANSGYNDKLVELIHTKLNTLPSYDFNITGGSTISHTVDLTLIHKLENFCSEESSVEEFVRRVKIVLCRDSNLTVLTDSSAVDKELKNDSSDIIQVNNFEDYSFKPRAIKKTRELLDACRVSKILRERLLKIFGLYNESIRNSLHAHFLHELHGALSNIDKMLTGFKDNPDMDIGSIDEVLSETIASFEEAYYNRFHQKDNRDVNLEYNGGIQQHITSFDFAYKEILRLLQPERADNQMENADTLQFVESFISVSGFERVSSNRMNLRININQITYPELFAISVWKEASNFTYNLLHQSYSESVSNVGGNRIAIDRSKKILLTWNRFIRNKNSFVNMDTLLRNMPYYNNDDEVFYLLSKITSREALEYFFIDAQSFHFGFNRDYNLFYYSYWKYFLQISQHYSRDGKIVKEYFISFLLRLFMVGFRDNYSQKDQSANSLDFLSNQRYKPFDSVFSDLWLMCYEKVFQFAQTLWDELNKRYFEIVGDDRMALLDYFIVKNDPIFKERLQSLDNKLLDKFLFDVIAERRNEISFKKDLIKEFKLVDFDFSREQNNDFILCLFNAYLQIIKELDESNNESEIKVRSVPRSSEGAILLDDEVAKMKNHYQNRDMVKEVLTNLPADPLGGLFIRDYKTRGIYFAYRTTFYKSLWNYTMKKRPYTIDKRII